MAISNAAAEVALSTVRVANKTLVVQGDAESEVLPRIERCLRNGEFCELVSRGGEPVRVNPGLVEEVVPFEEYEPWVA